MYIFLLVQKDKCVNNESDDYIELYFKINTTKILLNQS